MNAYVTRLAFPGSLEALNRMLDNNQGRTDLDVVLAEEPLHWSLPRSVFSNDIVFFQCTLTSRSNFESVLTEAGASRDRRAKDYLLRSKDIVWQSSGKLIAVGRIEARAVLAEEQAGAHFRQRTFAPVGRVHRFKSPLEVVAPSRLAVNLEFCSGGNLSNRAFGTNRSFQQVIRALVAGGNKLPGFLRGARVRPVNGGEPLNAGNWIDYVKSGDAGFLLEAHLRLNFSDFLLRAVSSRGRLHEEVRVETGGGQVAVVDNVILVGTELVPVEIKLNIEAEPDFLGQIRKYTRATLQAKNGRELGHVNHGVVLSVDSRGVYLLKDAKFWKCGPNRPWLSRADLSVNSLRRLAAALRQLTARAEHAAREA